jgi:anti-sigma factor RsiW
MKGWGMIMCTQTNRVGAYRDGEMSPADGDAMRQHLGDCPSCQTELDRLSRLTSLLAAAAPPAELSSAARSRLHRAIDGQASSLAGLGGLVRLAEVLSAVAAVLLLACILGLAGLRPGSTPGAPAGDLPTWQLGVTSESAEMVSDNSDELVTNWMTQDLSRNQGND